MADQAPTDPDQKQMLTWWQFQKSNPFIYIFFVALAFLITACCLWNTFYSLGGFLIALFIPIAMMLLIAYKAFYQFWQDYKNGTSR
jgi:hypothetical protein